MRCFLKLNLKDGQDILVNINKIVHISKYHEDLELTVVVFDSAGGQDENYIIVKNKYDEVFNYICETGSVFNK